MSEKVLIIGWDGADWRILQPMLDRGELPHLATMIQTGTSGNLRSTIPTNSNVAWTTFMTGRNPGKHAVYDFAQRSPHNPRLVVHANSTARRSETFFDVLGRHEKKVGAINIPATIPPFAVNGFMLGGMIVPEGQKYTYPDEFSTEIERLGGFHLNAMPWLRMLNQLDDLLDEAILVTEQRAKILAHLIDHKEWDVLTYIFVATDRLQHPFMHILDQNHPHYTPTLANRYLPKLRQIFRNLDNALGQSRKQLGDDATIMLISDHGFHSVQKAVFVREILIQAGLSKVTGGISKKQIVRKLLKPFPRSFRQAIKNSMPGVKGQIGSPAEMRNLDWSQTKAFATTLTGQGIYVNLKGREPNGTVSPGPQYEKLLDEITELLLAQRDPENGKPIIQEVMRAKEYYSGPWISQSPDLLYVPAPGYAAAKGVDSHLKPYQGFMGDHDLNGILVASGPDVRSSAKIDDAHLQDIAPTTLYLTGATIPGDMDGGVLDIFADGRLQSSPPNFENSVGYQATDYTFSAKEEQVVEERLRDLGYM